jgi:peptide/nickel transport system substrate-binding protein
MRSQPWYYTLFKILLGFGFLFFLAMMYWSSLRLEEDIKQVKKEIIKLEDLIKKLELKKVTIQEPLYSKKSKASSVGKEELTNLLSKDLFYSDILPNQLLPKDFTPQGTLYLDIIGKPNSLHPFINMMPFSSFIDRCNVSIATMQFGKYETLSPEFAYKMEERSLEDGSIEYWLYLRDDIYWQPLNIDHFPKGMKLDAWFLEKHQVTADDVKFYFDAIMNPFVSEPGAVSLRSYFSDIEYIEVVNDTTLRVKWKQELIDGKFRIKYSSKDLTGSLKPLASFVYKHFANGKKIIEDDSDSSTYRQNSVWAEQFATHFAKNIIVSCGPWIFDGMDDQKIKFKRNEDYFDPYQALVEAIEVNFKDTPENIWQDFQAGLIDYYSLDSSKLLDYQDFLQSNEYKWQKSKGLAIHDLSYIDRAYAYIGWNHKTPYFAAKKVRQAMTYAIDIDRLILQNLNNMGVSITGTFAMDSPAFDPTLQRYPFDPEMAKKFLEEEGWIDRDGDGIRDKEINGEVVPFRFSLKYYVKNQMAKKNAESIRSMLLNIGVDLRPEGLDVADLIKSFDDKEFEAIYFGWALGTPPEDPKQLWHSKGADEKGSSNAVGFSNKEADLIIEKLVYENDQTQRQKLYHQFSKILLDEQPYTFLFSPKVTLVYRDYVKNVFIPTDLKGILPGVNVTQPDLRVIWLEKNKEVKE